MSEVSLIEDMKLVVVNFFGNRVYKCYEIFSVKYDLRCKNSSNNRSKKDNKIRGEKDNKIRGEISSSSKFFLKIIKKINIREMKIITMQ